MNTNVFKLLTLVALAGCGLAAAGVVNLWYTPELKPDARPVLAWQPDFNPSPVVSGKDTAQLSYDELVVRPIFSPSRQPFVLPAPVVVEPPPEPVAVAPVPEPVPAPAPEPEPVLISAPPPPPLTDPQLFQLKGIMQSGNQISALITTPDNPDGRWLLRESNIMGWRLDRIERNSIVLKGDGRTVTLQQYTDKPPLDAPKAAADALGVQPYPNSSALN
jgi:hypothetical protein